MHHSPCMRNRVIAISILGPAILDIIHYRTSQSIILQTKGFDITNLILLVPLLIVGGIFAILKKDSSKYFLVLTPIMLIYSGMEYGISQEWVNPAYSGNSEAFSGLFLTLTIGGLILLLGSLSRFNSKDAPDFKTKWLRVYVAVMAAFLLMFAFMWLRIVTGHHNWQHGSRRLPSRPQDGGWSSSWTWGSPFHLGSSLCCYCYPNLKELIR